MHVGLHNFLLNLKWLHRIFLHFPVYVLPLLSTSSTVIVVFCGRNGKFAAAKFAPFRNLLQI